MTVHQGTWPRGERGQEIAEIALRVEHDPRAWAVEFDWLLRHPAIGPLDDGDDGALSVGSIAGQFAARFPVVSGDAEWLGQRSMSVVARRVAPLLAQGARVALDLSSLSRGEAGGAVAREQMRLVADGLEAALPEALRRFGVAPGRLMLSASADHPGLGDLLRLRASAAAGRPRIVIRVPDRVMLELRGAHGEAGAADPEVARLWQGITGLAHREPGIHLVLGRTTRPACALAASERPDAILPASLFEARADSAWLALRIRLDALGFAAPRDVARELRRLLRAGLRLADNLVEQLEWPTPELAQDALVNRRLALHVTGIGGWVDRLGLDPAAFPTVDVTMRWLSLVRRILHRESNALARERGPFPGLELRDLASTLTHSFGAERARRLLRQAGLRHRHLLVLSPYSVFPEGAARFALPSYLHLLPAIRWADTIAMHGDGVARALPATAFRRLLRLTAAIAHNRP